MKIDLHCHTRYSHDNLFDPRDLIQEAVEKGLDGVCITDHFSVEASLPVQALPRPEGFLVLRGVEISTRQGHVLAFGPLDDAWNVWGKHLDLDLDRVAASIKNQGGICVPAHPFRGLEGLEAAAFDTSRFDAVETMNGFNSQKANERAREMALKHRMPQTGGSDCHGEGQVGKAYTLFEKRINSMAGLVGEIKAGRCRAMGPCF